MALCDFMCVSLHQDQIYSFTSRRNVISLSASHTRARFRSPSWTGVFPSRNRGGFFFDQHLIRLNCNTDRRGRSLKKRFGNIPCFSRQCPWLCVSICIFTLEHAVTLRPVLCGHLRKSQSLGLNELAMPFMKRLWEPNIYHPHSTGWQHRANRKMGREEKGVGKARNGGCRRTGGSGEKRKREDVWT